jgi:DNA-directed RNA polymerase subunit RPC12/RpoP
MRTTTDSRIALHIACPDCDGLYIRLDGRLCNCCGGRRIVRVKPETAKVFRQLPGSYRYKYLAAVYHIRRNRLRREIDKQWTMKGGL